MASRWHWPPSSWETDAANESNSRIIPDQSLGAIDPRHYRHDLGDQPAIWLDVLCPADDGQAWLEQRADFGGVRHFPPHGTLAGADRGVPGRPVRFAFAGVCRRSAGGGRLDDQF